MIEDPTVTLGLLLQAEKSLKSCEPLLQRLNTIFSERGYELYLVGGSVRDALLGKEAKDLDFATNALPEVVAQILSESNCKALWDTGIAFGTVGALFDDYQVEITTYRQDTYDGLTRKPNVNYGSHIETDLTRRDFTINAISIRIDAHGKLEIYDPLQGIAAIAAKTIDTPDLPEISFHDDPLRMLRAVRFCAQCGFSLSPRVIESITQLAPMISRVSAERIAAELDKIMLTEDPIIGIDTLCALGLAQYIIPEVPAMKMTVDEHMQHKDVYLHSLTVLRQAIDREDEGPDLVLRWAALLHDIGKPATRKCEKNNVVSFHHHEIVGAKMARKRLRALKYPRAFIEQVCGLISLHLRFYGYSSAIWTDAAVRRYVVDAGDLLPRLHKLIRADCTTRNKRKAQRLQSNYDTLEQRIQELAAQETLASIRPELDGNAIMQILDIPSGPLVGKAWSFLKELRIECGEIGYDATKEKLLSWWSDYNSQEHSPEHSPEQ